MLLSDLNNIIDIKKKFNYKKNKKFTKITSTSKLADKNTLLIIKPNKSFKKKYLKEAIKKNIPGIISKKLIKDIKTTQYIVDDVENESKKILKKLFPFSPNNTIAITGTNGKTSVAWYISEILRINKINSKMLGTLGFFINGKKKNETYLTTPPFEEIYQYGNNKFKRNYNFIFEASSHALSQNRLDDYNVDLAAITNISQDHLDFHKNEKNYVKAKFSLFKKYLNKEGVAIVNSRLKFFNLLIKFLKKNKIKTTIFGSKDIFFSNEKKKLILKIYNKKYNLKNLNLSELQKENIECAISCLLNIGFSPKLIINSLSKIINPPGRMDEIKFKKKNTTIIIDYAHTPDALKKILLSQTINKKKPSLVFGCGGDRDKSKRKIMALVAHKYANKVYVTDDNPRYEDPSKIRKEILNYCKKGVEFSSRKKAIFYAITNIDQKEILVIAGKGHEKFQIFKNQKVAFDDYKIAEKIVKNL